GRTGNLSGGQLGGGERVEGSPVAREVGLLLAVGGRLVCGRGVCLVHFLLHLLEPVAGGLLPAWYRIETVRCGQADVLANTAMWAPMRGPWAIEALGREALSDTVARELDLDPAEVRRRNIVSLEEQPRKLTTGPTLEGSYALAAFEAAMESFGYEEQRGKQ